MCWRPFLFKCCLCFSLVPCSNFVGYHLTSRRTYRLNFGELFGENSVRRKFTRRKFRLAKFPFGENSIRRKFRSAKITFGENSFGENSVGENSFGKNSGHAFVCYVATINMSFGVVHSDKVQSKTAFFWVNWRNKLQVQNIVNIIIENVMLNCSHLFYEHLWLYRDEMHISFLRHVFFLAMKRTHQLSLVFSMVN